MHSIEKIHCPNCGSFAQRHHFSGLDGAEFGCPKSLAVRIECDACDYLMTTCELNGRVVEACAIGVYSLNSYSGLQPGPIRGWESMPVQPSRQPVVAASVCRS